MAQAQSLSQSALSSPSFGTPKPLRAKQPPRAGSWCCFRAFAKMHSPLAARRETFQATRDLRSMATRATEDRRDIDKSEDLMEDPYGPVEEAMNYNVITVDEIEPLENILEHLERFTGLPVVNKEGKCVGVISDKDVAKFMEDNHCEDEEAALKLLQEPIRKVMTAPAITIKEHAPIAFAAGLMLQHKVHRLPVTDREGKVVGIITRRDIYKPLLAEVNPLYKTSPLYKNKTSDWHSLGD